MKLRTGISEVTPGWKLILQQIGVPFQPVNINHEITPEEWAVLIISSWNISKNKKNILRYMEAGGSLLMEADTARQLLDIKVKSITIKYLSSPDTSLFNFISPLDLDKQCKIVSPAQWVENQKGKKTISIKTLGKGTALILPSGLMVSLLDYSIKRRSFYSEFGQRLPTERVSRISKGGIRNLILSGLKYLFQVRNLPFLHLWYFPQGNRTQFSFRVDTDFSSQKQVEELYKMCRKHNLSATWFVETKSQADWIRYYREMENQEIGYHCYRHRLFPDAEKTREDFQQGMSLMEKEKIRPEGYAAPYGEWYPGLARLVQEYNFKYSSEFGLAYDDFPYYPYVGDSSSSVLQIPIHPISTGSLRRARHSKEDMIDYYSKMIRIKQAVYEPIIFYHHPVHGYFDVFDTVFHIIREQNIPVVSLGDFSKWWEKRTSFDWNPEILKGTLYLHPSCINDSLWCKISLSSGKEILNPVTKKSHLLSGEYTVKTKQNFSHIDFKQLRQFNWRMWVHDFNHYWGKLKK